ncbi:hypothetical protein C8R48DRAFT_673089 [Suillus tomentosus]|nr:hypothetical protein C8R48DRAFT_673089 [Suillus tomentosus]
MTLAMTISSGFYMESVNVNVSWLWLWCLSRNKDSRSRCKKSIYFRLDLSFSSFLVAQVHMLMEDNPHPGTSSQVGDTSRPITASSTAVTTSENTQQKQQISDLVVTVVEEKPQVLESESGHAMKRGENSQGQPRLVRRMTSLDYSIEVLPSENDHENDDDHSVSLIIGHDRLRIGLEYATLNDDHLHTPRKRSRDEGRVRQDLIVANTQLRLGVTTQAQHQLQDSQNRIDSLHSQVFDLRERLYDVERAHNIAEMYVEMLQTSGLGDRRRKNLSKRKTMMHEHYPDGGQSIRWVTDEEFGPYDNSSAEEGPPVTQAVAGPLACGLAASQRLTLSRRQLAWRRLQAAKNASVYNEPSSPTYPRVDGTPEV